MLILKDTRKVDVWITAIIADHYVSAKVYDEPSSFGVNNGRISKIQICADVKFNPDKVIYAYDRGLDFDRLPAGLLDKILAELEALPKVNSLDILSGM